MIARLQIKCLGLLVSQIVGQDFIQPFAILAINAWFRS